MSMDMTNCISTVSIVGLKDSVLRWNDGGAGDLNRNVRTLLNIVKMLKHLQN